MRKQQTFTVALALAVSLNAVSASAGTAEDCVEIRDRAARLECFDQVFPRRKDGSPPAPEAEDSAQDAPVVVAPPPDRPASEPAPAQPAPDERQAGERRFGLPGLGGLFDRGETQSITSRVVAVRQRDKQKMVFLLENDQIWIQVSPRDVPIEEGDMVTVSSTLMGGHMLRTAHGVTTRVNRIR